MNDSAFRQEGEDWMYQCLAESKSLIKKYHVDYDAKKFFENTTYELYLQNKSENIYANVDISSNSNHFPIGIDLTLSEDTPKNQRTLVIVLVHQLLHVIHDKDAWTHDKIILLENNLANLGGYFDALMELRLAESNKMRFCKSF